MTVFVAVLLSVMQESVDELGSENIQGVTPILKLCPASGPSIAIVFSSDLWELHEQTRNREENPGTGRRSKIYAIFSPPV